MVTRQEVLHRLQAVHDPEIPDLSIVDMGMVTDVVVTNDSVEVTLRPTYIGCPALDWIKSAVERALEPTIAEVQFNMTALWSTSDLSEQGRDRLKRFGIAPPREGGEAVECPHCGSDDTHMTSPFGSTLCRSIYYCQHCQVPFEAWKTLGRA
ncbi:1,2-phenylacetyl-CoA epoxidase subunit PaaD [Sulfobacillus harzensis]|uniref:Phenylacetate-CoA oxygenase subunit PaaJ n=1 Tax=Sulfobacillus harzensis TaxID=2729629 RepID=A0A7Y0Q428_9FIRM|nr:1,2-phenylacetyl-CoA epoxidase subunit PaaD [Sulfobacillus harzensis]NMP22804.1 phenylacetate-CoA oxygenase subunit PaaJ [Sulfobacillus harzensis]